jgi:hypothetical protein
MVIKTNYLILYGKIIAVSSGIHKKHTNIICGQNLEIRLKLAVYNVIIGL